jgi:hypothetical protein
MTFCAPSEKAAANIAARLTELRAGKPSATGFARTITRFIVERYAKPDGRFRHQDFNHEWGIVERWTYNDRPDLPEFGGAFTWLTPELLAMS